MTVVVQLEMSQQMESILRQLVDRLQTVATSAPATETTKTETTATETVTASEPTESIATTDEQRQRIYDLVRDMSTDDNLKRTIKDTLAQMGADRVSRLTEAQFSEFARWLEWLNNERQL